jgi:hypothetical protein
MSQVVHGQGVLGLGQARYLLAAVMAKRKSKVPWKRASPHPTRHKKLSAKEKAEAKRMARAAGRPYPNLVDNMREARKKK